MHDTQVQSSELPSQLPELPEMDAGTYLLETGQGHGIKPLHSLVIDHVLLNDRAAYWVDAGQYAVTTSLRKLAPSDRVLDRIQIARGFTPYQHTGLLRRLQSRLENDAPSIIVTPAIDAHYRSEDIQGDTGEQMLVSALADLARAARDADVPVLLTHTKPDEFAAPVAQLSDHTIEYKETPHGPRFTGEAFETLVYPLGDGWVQTTIAFWHEILEAREPLYTDSPADTSQGVSVDGAY